MKLLCCYSNVYCYDTIILVLVFHKYLVRTRNHVAVVELMFFPFFPLYIYNYDSFFSLFISSYHFKIEAIILFVLYSIYQTIKLILMDIELYCQVMSKFFIIYIWINNVNFSFCLFCCCWKYLTFCMKINKRPLLYFSFKKCSVCYI